MKEKYRTIEELLVDEEDCPIKLAFIPNYLGINLNSVSGIYWERQDDNQLVSLHIYFIPEKEDKV